MLRIRTVLVCLAVIVAARAGRSSSPSHRRRRASSRAPCPTRAALRCPGASVAHPEHGHELREDHRSRARTAASGASPCRSAPTG